MEQETRMGKMKPCPFCGGSVKIITTVSEFYIQCTTCHLRVTADYSHVQITHKWNQRIGEKRNERD